MLCKNQTITAECTALGVDFEGICRHEGQVVFVRGLLPGERGQVKVIKTGRQSAVGRLERLLCGSPDRTTPLCPYFPRCGGCTAQHLAYPATLAHKRQQVYDCLLRIGGVDMPRVEAPLGMETPWRYRNKGAFPVGGTAEAPRIGCFAARSHDIVDAPGGCLLQSEQSDALVGAARGWMAACGIAPYDEATHTGLVRHVMTREAANGGAMLALVVNGRGLPLPNALVDRAREAAPGLRSVVVVENTRRTNVILGDRFHTVWGEDALEDQIAGLRMRVSPRSFFQVNRAQAERLYEAALARCNLTGTETVWDVYCGCGSITLPLAKQCARVIGIEVVEDAVRDARENARRNNIVGAEFIAGAAEAVLPALAARHGAPDVVVVDPPRKGCEPEALTAIAEAAPARIVYVSCNPATLARDVKLLAARGYRPGAAQPVDMFAWTGHVECVVALTKEERRI